MKFYKVTQKGICLGYFKELSNAKEYSKQFNTKVEVCPVRIVEETFMDGDEEGPWGRWDESDHDYGAV